MPRASRVLAGWSSFERVRTELCYAERLRRVRRTTEAHAHFRSALGTFEQLGAEPWALRARRGLARQGSRGRRATPLDAPLSAHESQVAGLVQRGATNRQVAATLFVTEKTVEYHLSNIYRKLGIRSRAELAWVLAKRPPEPGGISRGHDKRELERMSPEELEKLVVTLEEEMCTAAEELRFEHAAKLRDEIEELRRELQALTSA